MTHKLDPDVIEILGDEYARAVLVALDGNAMTARALSEECGFSLPTVYRRLETLAEHGLVAARGSISEDGNHSRIYRRTLDRLVLTLDGDGYTVQTDQAPRV